MLIKSLFVVIQYVKQLKSLNSHVFKPFKLQSKMLTLMFYCKKCLCCLNIDVFKINSKLD